MGFLAWLRGRLRRAGEAREGLFCPKETCFGTEDEQEASPDAPERPCFALDDLRQGNIPSEAKNASEGQIDALTRKLEDMREVETFISAETSKAVETIKRIGASGYIGYDQASRVAETIIKTGPWCCSNDFKPVIGFLKAIAGRRKLEEKFRTNNWRKMHGLPMIRRAAMRRLHARRGR